MTELRPERAGLKVTGAEAGKLLNDVLTCSIPQAEGNSQWWALLSAQGKIQAEGLISFFDGAYYLDVARDIADHFFRRMGMYKLRAKAEIIDLRDSHVVGWSSKGIDIGNGLIDADNRAGGLGFRLIMERAQARGWKSQPTQFTRARIGLCVSELGADFDADALFPHDIGMDILKGVDFAKGCYVGQEVVSRMQHRGTARRRPVLVRLSSGQKGDTIMIGDRAVGKLGQVHTGFAIGNVRVDKISNAADAQVNGSSVELAVPPWASYAFASDSIPRSDS